MREPIILGVKIVSHDTGAALIAGNRVVAIAEERLNRVKHSPRFFPKLSIDYCLRQFSLEPRDVDLVVIDQVGDRATGDMKEIFTELTKGTFSRAESCVLNHHDAHAASAFFCSHFDDAAILIVDGAGEKIRTNIGVIGTETETLYRGVGNKVFPIQKTTHIRRRARFPFTIGIGKLYGIFSEKYLGFGHYNEGKMMGLAPYGKDTLLRKFPLDRWFKEHHGHIICNPGIVFKDKQYTVKKKKEKVTITISRAMLKPFFFWILQYASPLGKGAIFTPHLFEPIFLDKPSRERGDKLPEDYYASVAYAAQYVLERVMVEWGKKVKNITGSKNLCVAGGVGLNIDANKKFLDEVGFERIFVQPASSDTGIPLGCALWGAHMILGLPRFYEMKSASLGQVYSDEEMWKAINARRDEVVVRKSLHIAEETARYIASGEIIGWFQGGSEYGPRALGNRSILCDARNPKMKDIVNEKVKHREPWRPFAASVLAERQSEWFELEHPSPFMLLAAKVREEKQKLIPSVVHVDGTCRIQSVTSEANAPYYELLKAFEGETGTPLILNTSFNDAGEPIVETPKDALDCFLKTEIDHLVIHDYIISKR